MKLPIWKNKISGWLFGLIFISAVGITVFLPVYSKSNYRINDYFYTQPHGLLADYYYYLAIINEGKIQSRETDPYTTEPHQAGFVHIYYLILGKISLLLNLPVISAYYLGLFVPLILYCLFSYLLVSYFYKNHFKWVALGIIFFTGPFPPQTVNILKNHVFLGTSWWTKMDPYSRLTSVPHHYFSSALMVGTVYFYLKYLKERRTGWAVICSLSLSLGVLVYGIPGFVFFIAFLIIFLIDILSKMKSGLKSGFQNSKLIWGNIIIGLSFAIPFVMVYFQLTRLGLPWSINLFWEYETFQAETYPIQFIFYAVNFGVLIPFAVMVTPLILHSKRRDRIFIWLISVIPFILWWLVVWGILRICKIRLIYTSPYVFMGLLASFFISEINFLIKTKMLRLLINLIFLVVISVNVYLGFKTYWIPQLMPDETKGNIYLHTSYLSGFDYLGRIAAPGDAVFTDLYMGMLIPAFTHTKSYIGHEVATLNYPQKQAVADGFYNGTLDKETAMDIFNKNSIRFVFWDKCLYPDPPDSYGEIMILIHQSGCAAVYRVSL